MCIHSEFMELKGNALAEACKKALKGKKGYCAKG
jgi:hypothetical protein